MNLKVGNFERNKPDIENTAGYRQIESMRVFPYDELANFFRRVYDLTY